MRSLFSFSLGNERETSAPVAPALIFPTQITTCHCTNLSRYLPCTFQQRVRHHYSDIRLVDLALPTPKTRHFLLLGLHLRERRIPLGKLLRVLRRERESQRLIPLFGRVPPGPKAVPQFRGSAFQVNCQDIRYPQPRDLIILETEYHIPQPYYHALLAPNSILNGG